MHKVVKNVVKLILNGLGLTLIRLNTHPENTLLGLHVFPVATVLDIGANTGQSAQLYRKLFPDAVIHSFEPLPDVYKTLTEWAQSQGGMVNTCNIALGDFDGEVTINRHTDHSPSSSILPITQHGIDLYPQTEQQQSIRVPIRTLDSIASEMVFPKEILVKMDVQGFEESVIKGGKDVIQQALGCVLEVSLQPLYQGQADFRRIYLLMSELGFEYGGTINQTYDQIGRVIYSDILFLNTILFAKYA